MIHLGDITQIHGGEIPVVDIITGGSPCQDLSVAGKRAGLDGERSGLFMEQIRIVKEMRERDRRTGRAGWLIRPRFMVWENVPGAFSSNKGADFQAVLTEIVKIVEPDAPDVPLPDKGKWPKAGCLYSDVGNWSVAWRVHDAQFWGVPQRRKRIALVADFGGLTAPEILFERKGMSRDSEPCGEAWEGVAEATGGGVDSTGWGWHNGTYYMDADIEADPTIRQQGDCIDSTYPTVARSLTQRYDGSPCIDRGPDVVVQNIDSVFCLQGNGIDRADTAGCNGKGWREDQSYTLNTIDRPAVYIPDVAHALSARHDGSPQPDKGNGANIVAVHQNASGAEGEGTSGTAKRSAGDASVYGICSYESNAMKSNNPHSGIYEADTSRTLDNNGGNPACNQGGMVVLEGNGSRPSHQGDGYIESDTMYTLNSTEIHAVLGTYQSVTGALNPGAHPGSYNGQDAYNDMLVAASLSARDYKGPCNQDLGNNMANYPIQNSVVRRLTPLECERLQGFPDGWTDIGEWTDSKGRLHKEADSPRYKALGNSIALPFWEYLARRICAFYERPATMGSLFDGIGGFPLAFERAGAKAVWASEIEEFPIAVTKLHFPEERSIE